MQPALLRGFDIRAVAGDPLRQLSEAIGVPEEQVRVAKRRFVRGQLGLQPLDLSWQPVVIALVLVG